MKILYITQRLPFGDGETFIIPEIDALLAAGHDVLVCEGDARCRLHRDAGSGHPDEDAAGRRQDRGRYGRRAGPGAGGNRHGILGDAPYPPCVAWAIANARAAAEGMWGGPPGDPVGGGAHPCALGPPHGHAGHERERRDGHSVELHGTPL